MNKNKSDLNVDFIGGEALTVAEELALHNYFSQKKTVTLKKTNTKKLQGNRSAIRKTALACK